MQDAYSLRCAPQVAGAARDTLDARRAVADASWRPRSTTRSSPLDGRVESNGNFHGAPVAYVLDFLAIAAADVASMAERRTDRFLDVARSHGLPPFLADDPGVDSGYMIAQYTQAAIVCELKRLAVAGVRGLASRARAMQEDHVSMGWSAARKLRRAVDALAQVLAIELLTAARGIELRAPLRARRRPPAPSSPPLRATSPAPAPTASSPPRSRRAAGFVESGGARRAAESRSPESCMKTTDPRRPRHRAVLPGLAAGGRAAHAAEQPRPRGRRAPRRARRLRRHGQGRARLGVLRRDRAHAADARATTRRCWCSPASPVGVMQTHEWAPRVLIANSNLVGDWANWDEFRRLEALGLTMYGQMTAGSWIYIGTQGILQGTYETFAAVANKRFGGSLAGTITLTGGLGGMGGAQPLAVTMAGGVAICVEVDAVAHRAPARTGYLDVEADDLDHALELRDAARDRSRCRSACSATAPTSSRSCSRRGAPIDIVTDQTSRPRPAGLRAERRRVRGLGRREGAPGATERARESMARHVEAMVGFQDAGAEVFDYGNSLRAEAKLGGYERAFDYPGFVPAYIRPLFCEGRGPVPLGRAVRRPGRHRRHRQGRARALPGARVARALDEDGRREGPVPGPAGADLLARPGRAPPRRPGVQRPRGERRRRRPDRDRPRPPRLRLRRLARTARPRRCSTAATRSPTGRC